MSSGPSPTLTLPPKGRVLSILTDDPRSPLHWLAMLEHELGSTISVYTRLSPQRLSQHLNLEKVEFKWLSETMDPHALSPSLERIHHEISTRIVTDEGIIWLDAVEFLIHRQGFDSFLAFTRSLADELNGSQWTVLLPFTPLSLDGTEIAHLRREAMPFEVGVIAPPRGVETQEIETVSDIDSETPEVGELAEESSVVDEKPSTIVMLSSIGEAALSPAVLARRMTQWEDMGFDVSSLEQAMKANPTERYEIYREVEESVRRAIECERRIQMIEIRGHTVEAAKMRFRIMQLTGLDDVELQLDEILQGEQA